MTGTNYFCFEGPDYSGKSTLMHRVSEILIEKELTVFSTREPGSLHSPVCSSIRRILQHSEITDELVYSGLYDIDRRIHLNDVVSNLKNINSIILSDRCIISSECYQEVKIEELRNLNKEKFLSFNPFIFYIDIDPETVLERSTFETMNIFEQNIFSNRIEKIFKNYKQIIPEYNHMIIDNRKSINIEDNVILIVNTIIEKFNGYIKDSNEQKEET